MSKTLHSFGTVLFDELEQVAVRRGRFASLEWVRRELTEARGRVAGSSEDAANPALILPFLEEAADRTASHATEVLARVTSAVEAVDRLGQVVSARGATSLSVVERIREPGPPQDRPVAFNSLTGLVVAIRGWARPTAKREDWRKRRDDARSKLQKLARRVEDARDGLAGLNLREEIAEAGEVVASTSRARRLARGVGRVEELPSDEDRAVARSYLEGLDKSFEDRDLEERLIRGSVIDRSRRLAEILGRVADQFGRVIEAYREIADACRGIPAQIGRLVEVQPDETRYEIGDIVEDGARATSLRLESVGLAFSGGGIRSATFNLGFLQGISSLGLLKHFDYLSTVSGGGYIGAWFAAWVRREGGAAGDPKRPDEGDIERAAAPHIAKARERIRNSPGMSPDEVEEGVEEAAKRIRGEVRVGLQSAYTAKIEASPPPTSGEVEGTSDAPNPPGEEDVEREAAPRIATEANLIREGAGARATREVIEQRVRRAEARIRDRVRADLEASYEAEVASKRNRTAQALENVETQLNPSRAVQGRARRRWVSWEETRKGREETKSPPPPLRRVVEEEPQPIYHLRAFSNFLAPKLGLTSIDTWTMISVYLRNLFLNQFILLPMMLAAIAVPRLGLILYARLTPQSPLGVAGQWLNAHPWWPAGGVLTAAVVAILTAPKLIDSLAQGIGRRVHWATDGRLAGSAMFLSIAVALATLAWRATAVVLPWLREPDSSGAVRLMVDWLGRFPWAPSAVAVAALALVAVARRRRGEGLTASFARGASDRAQGWAILVAAVSFLSLVAWVVSLGIRHGASFTDWLTGDRLVFLVTFAAARLGFHRTYRTVALIRESRLPVVTSGIGGGGRFDLPYPILWEQILVPLTLVAFGVSLLFVRAGKGFLDPTLPMLGDFAPTLPMLGDDYARWLALPVSLALPLYFGTLVGFIRLVAFAFIDIRDRSRRWREYERAGRAASAFVSGLIGGTTLAFVLSTLHGWLDGKPGVLAAAMMTFGPLLVLIAMGAGSAIEVGLIGDYGEEDMREWRASLGAYLLMIGLAWTSFSAVSIYGPLLIWRAPTWISAAAGVGWVFTSAMGALAGRSARTDGRGGSHGPLEYVALIAPAVFIFGLVIAIAMLATVLQSVEIPVDPSIRLAGGVFLERLSQVRVAGATWAILLASAWLATVGCAYVNINLFALNAFYANRLVRCYLGASRPREATAEGRSAFAPTNCPVPVRRPNPITGFDPTDDFPMRDLAIVREWGKDLVVDYRGPYHLVNTAMNLVAGTELAWQERMAESFVVSPLYCGSKTTGFRKTDVRRGDLEDAEIEPEERAFPDDREVPGFGGDIRLGTAVSVSGAAASPNAGYHSSPLVTILLTVFNARLGLWFGNPARDAWRKSGPGFALYLFDELLGRTTSKGKYVYLSDGGHFENLGVYELVRRRCRHIVVCDAGADPGSSFWDLGGLVRKCREDFGVRIEIDISPLLKEDAAARAKWHCAVGLIHYEDVDGAATPGTLFYVKPSLTGDEPSDVRNYVVEHPTFPHESTADQFFSESQFESYRVLGEHIATNVFRDAVVEAGTQAGADLLFSKLRRRWFPPPAGHDEAFLDAVKPFTEIHQALRSDSALSRFAAELYPEAARTGSDGGRACPKELHVVIEMLQAMESTWMTVGLASHASHPLNRGWMNAFRRWASSRSFQDYWPAVRGEFSEGFVRFCEAELNLKVDDPEIAWLDAGRAKQWGRGLHPRPLIEFREALTTLDGEFTSEWPDLSIPEIGDQAANLCNMLDHAIARPPVTGFGPLAGLIVSRPSTRPDGPTTAEPRLYGAVLAWKSSDRVIDLTIWVRGAYRTLGIGRGTIEAMRAALQQSGARGDILRARYPSDLRVVVERRWQGDLWADFFRSQGFHRVGPAPGDDVASFITLERDV